MTMTAQERYLNDPVFNRLVDMIRHAIESNEYTASEVREAAILAAIHYEQRHLRRYLVLPGDDMPIKYKK